MIPILMSDYDYPLTDDRIAKYPLPQRDHSKLLVYDNGTINEDQFFHIGQYLLPQSLLVYNNTRVIPARLIFHKKPTLLPNGESVDGAKIEIFCLEPYIPHDYALSLAAIGNTQWKCMVGNLKKWKTDTLSTSLSNGLVLTAERISTNGNTHIIHFSWNDDTVTFASILEQLGELPIPPYLNRPTEESDKTTYQTVYSRIKGSVAAPTAGLHFTDTVLNGLRQQGHPIAEVTLHVGAGTFQPVKTEDANQHTMHTEIIAVSKNTIEQLLSNLGNITAVGTTTMRTLESLYYIGVQLKDSSSFNILRVSQFEPYEQHFTLTTEQALMSILDYLHQTNQDTLHAETQIMIRPGYQFHLVNQLITNFHQPHSTLLLLVSAFVGEQWRDIYNYALAHDFRFLSYGDSSILTLNSKL